MRAKEWFVFFSRSNKEKIVEFFSPFELLFQVLEKGSRFTLRDAENKTVGTGVVTNLHPDPTPEELKKFWKRAA